MGLKVLVVDDHAPTVELIRDALLPHGYQVITAENGVACLLAVDEHEPDCIVMDVAMPVLNGLDALRLLRQRFDDRSLPIIMLSGQGQFPEVRNVYRGGADIYLDKPVRVAAVVAAVRWLLHGGEALPQESANRTQQRVLASVVADDLY